MHSAKTTSIGNMMKFVLATLAVLALSTPMEAYKVPRTGNGALADELQDFADIIPVDDMIALILEYVSSDAEVQKVLEYLQGTEFKSLVTDLEAMPEVIQVMNYIQNAGVDAYLVINKLNDYLGLKKLTPPAVYKITGGLRGLLDDLEAMLPQDKIKTLYYQKLSSSKVFADCVKFLSSPVSQGIADKVCANQHFHNVLDMARKSHIDVTAVKDLLEKILGITVPCKI